AVGQEGDVSFAEDGIKTRAGLFLADKISLETSMEGVFAGGDNVLGPSSLVDAVAQGHRAARSIDLFLSSRDLKKGRKAAEKSIKTAEIPILADRTKSPRQEPLKAEIARRTLDFTEIETGFTMEMAVAEARRCLNCGGCSLCMECVKTCKAKAVQHDMRDCELTINVGSIILAAGYDLFDAKAKAEYGFGRYANVVTGMQFERILSASGPYHGHIQKPSDKKPPKKIAWIQCVGSRDISIGNNYCSSVCCMYAVKQAVVAKEHDGNIEATVFFIDIRAFGKGCEDFYMRAKTRYGIRFIRSQVSSLKDNPQNQNIIIRYVSGNAPGEIAEQEFDMAVLSTGLVAGDNLKALTNICGISSNSYGFALSNPLWPVNSSRHGIFICGAVNGPKDIPETVMQSSAAAALCGEILKTARNTQIKIEEYPLEKKVTNKEPRIGVFICHCGINIASVVDVDTVTREISKIPNVVHSEHNLYTCSQDTQKKIKEIIIEKDLNRVIVASCTPRTHAPLFQETIRGAGLNKHLFEMADIREQCSWVHQQEPDKATEKAISLIRGSLGKSRNLKPIPQKKVDVTPAGLVIGGGISGITAALSLANQGYEVYLVEKKDKLGGNLSNIRFDLEGHNWHSYMNEQIEKLKNNNKVKIHLNSEIESTNGFIGNFHTKLKGQSNNLIKHGIVIVATGAAEIKPGCFLYSENDNILTQLDFEKKLDNNFKADKIVMIQCAGSRSDARPYCSRVCCAQAIKNAITAKNMNPDTDIYILYRDIRTYGFKEEYYYKAREMGIKFIRFPDDKYPEVIDIKGKLQVAVIDALLYENIRIEPDWVILSSGITPEKENNQRISEILKVPLNQDNFFMEAHIKLRPVDFANEGVFLCGLAHSPKFTQENITQALAAAGRAACVLAKDSLEVGGIVSTVDQSKCAVCLTCIRECIFNAPFINSGGKAEIQQAKCQGCGNCASACPAKAIQLGTFTDLQELELVREILRD
ncbi:MAG: FAD-dependent oxidoreductase, partial [bacterium]